MNKRTHGLFTALPVSLLLLFSALLVSCDQSAPQRTPIVTLSPAPAVAAMRELGTLSQPAWMLGRNVGGVARLGEQVLWVFNETLFRSAAPDGSRFRSTLLALGPRNSPLVLIENSDIASTPPEFLPLTDEERAYNKTGSLTERYALWVGSVLTTSTQSGDLLVFYQKMKIKSSYIDTERLGTGVAQYTAGRTTALRDPNLLFTASEPSFQDALAFESYAYVYGCNSDGGLAIPCRIARAPLARARDRTAYEFWNGTTWGVDVGQAAPVLRGAWTGLTVSWNPYLQRFLAVYSTIFSNDVMLRTAPRPEGPWSAPALMFTGTAPAGEKMVNTGARQLPAFTSNNGRTLVVSYYRPFGGFAGEVRLVEVTLQ